MGVSHPFTSVTQTKVSQSGAPTSQSQTEAIAPQRDWKPKKTRLGHPTKAPIQNSKIFAPPGRGPRCSSNSPFESPMQAALFFFLTRRERATPQSSTPRPSQRRPAPPHGTFTGFSRADEMLNLIDGTRLLSASLSLPVGLCLFSLSLSRWVSAYSLSPLHLSCSLPHLFASIYSSPVLPR